MFRVGRAVQRPKRLKFPLIVKSLTQESSIGISQASVVEDDSKLQERVHFIHHKVGTDAIVERYIEGRELYVGVLGNLKLQVFPIWELQFKKMGEDAWPIATERVKWSDKYQKKHEITSGHASDLSEELALRVQKLCKRVYRTLDLSGYARIDLRLDQRRPRPRARGESEPAARLRRGLRRVGGACRGHLRAAPAADHHYRSRVAPRTPGVTNDE